MIIRDIFGLDEKEAEFIENFDLNFRMGKKAANKKIHK
jgi:hypothetical protein